MYNLKGIFNGYNPKEALFNFQFKKKKNIYLQFIYTFLEREKVKMYIVPIWGVN